jgi:hypothetical protein
LGANATNSIRIYFRGVEQKIPGLSVTPTWNPLMMDASEWINYWRNTKNYDKIISKLSKDSS